MKHWFNKNYKTFIITAFLIPILTVAVVSISHVTQWYGISNPVTWSVYLSIGIEIAALSALAAISANMGSKVYFPFIVVTLIQFIGNIFFAYSYIDINSKSFKDWVDLVSPLVEFIGVEPGDVIGHKRFLALFAGGMLPIISLSFLHMLVKFTEEDRKKEQQIINEEERHLIDDNIIQEAIEKYKKEQEENSIDPSEIARIKLSEEDLKKLEETLLNPPPPNEKLIRDEEKYKEQTEEDILKEAEKIKSKRLMEKMKEIQKAREEVFGPDEDEEEPTALANSQYTEMVDDEDWGDLTQEDLVGDDEIIKETQNVEPSTSPQNAQEMMLTTNDDIISSIPSDDEISDWDSTLEDGLVDENNFQEEPTEEEENQNFSTIEPISENIFQEEENNEEPEIEITNTQFNEFGNMISEIKPMEEENSPIEQTQFVPLEVIDETPELNREITINFSEEQLKPFDFDVSVQPETTEEPISENESDLGEESLSEKKNF